MPTQRVNPLRPLSHRHTADRSVRDLESLIAAHLEQLDATLNTHISSLALLYHMSAESAYLIDTVIFGLLLKHFRSRWHHLLARKMRETKDK